ncbi:unnamed protein product [Caretta caretta]
MSALGDTAPYGPLQGKPEQEWIHLETLAHSCPPAVRNGEMSKTQTSGNQERPKIPDQGENQESSIPTT